jgi:hypothetical protein
MVFLIQNTQNRDTEALQPRSTLAPGRRAPRDASRAAETQSRKSPAWLM